MLNHDQLQQIPDRVKLGYLRAMVEKLIADAGASQCLKLRRTQARLDALRRKYKPQDAMLRMFDDMWLSFLDLNDALGGR